MSKWTVSEITTRGLGAVDVSFSPGAINELVGSNATGKTLTLESIRNIRDGGFDPDLLRDGCTEGYARFELTDSEGKEPEIVITKTITRKGARLTVEQDGAPIQGTTSKAFVDSCFDEIAMDPGDFVNPPGGTPQARDAQRIALLKFMSDVVLETAEFEAAAGVAGANLVKLAGTGNAFERIDSVKEALYAKRTEKNSLMELKRGEAKTLKGTLPEVAEAGPTVFGLGVLKDEKAVLEEDRAGALNRVSAEGTELIATVNTSRIRDLDSLEASLNEQVAKIKAEAAARIKEMENDTEKLRERRRQAGDAEVLKLRETFDAERAAIQEKYAPKLEALAAEIAVAEERERVAKEREAARLADEVRANTLKEMVAKATADADAAEKESRKLSTAIERLDALHRTKMSALPVKGLEVKGKRVYFNGRAYDNKVNDAEKWKAAIQVASCRVGKVGLVVVDRAESLGDAVREAIAETAREMGLKILLATAVREDGHPLTVETKS